MQEENKGTFLAVILYYLKEWGLFLLILTAFILTRIYVWSPVTVDGHSMDPTLEDGEKIIMVKTTTIERFDIVVASETDDNGTEKLIVKRVIGMPGDTIRYENDILYVNDEEVEEEYLAEFKAAFALDKLQSEYSYSTQFQSRAQFASAFTTDSANLPIFTVEVPEGEYYLLGDNRLVSADSREVGTFSADAIEGEIVFRYWPFSQFGGV